jgi:hypothetical protein
VVSHKPKRSDLIGSATRERSLPKKQGGGAGSGALLASSKSNLKPLIENDEKNNKVSNSMNYLINVSPKDKEGGLQ